MNKKRILLYTSAASLLLATSVGSYQLVKYDHQQKDNKLAVDYVSAKADKAKAGKSSEKSMDQISKEEGISAEQIVIKITDQGYVTSHGDHFHFYNGKVPYDAKISEDLVMKDPKYVFKKSDVINAIKDGYIIKLDGKYYAYIKPGTKASNIRTKAEIEEQVAKGTNEAKEKGLEKVAHLSKEEAKLVSQARSQGRYTTDDGYVFSPSDVIDDMGDAFLVPHGNHFHYIPKSDLSPQELAAAQAFWNSKSGHQNVGGNRHNSITVSGNGNFTDGSPSGNLGYQKVTGLSNLPTASPVLSSRPEFKGKSFGQLLDQLHKQPLSKRHVEGDGLIFEPTKVTKVNNFGYVIPHGDHFHIIPRWQLSPLESHLADLYLTGQTNTPNKATKPKPVSNDGKKSGNQLGKQKSHQFLGHTISVYGKGLDGKPYDTSDHYVFSKDSIEAVDNTGVTARHHDHFHYIGFGELEQFELDQVANWLKKHGQDKVIAKSLVDLPVANKDSHFDAKLVTKKVKHGDVNGYIVSKNGIDYFIPIHQLDLTQQAFAEQELMLKAGKDYKYAIADSSIKPRLALDVSSLPMHAANATVDTGTAFIIPHIDHIHVVPYKWLNEDQIATIKYVMQNPHARPEIWSTPGHDDHDKVIANATPLDKRAGLKNWQIIHTAQEVQEALKNGRYATPDGYIFDASDLLEEGTFIWSKGSSFSIKRADLSSLREIERSQLNAQEQIALDVVLKEREAKEAQPSKETVSSKPREKEKSKAANEKAIEESSSSSTANSSEVAGQASTEESGPDQSADVEESQAVANEEATFGLDKATYDTHLNQLAQISGIPVERLIITDQGVQFYDKTGKLVTYDLVTLNKIA